MLLVRSETEFSSEEEEDEEEWLEPKEEERMEEREDLIGMVLCFLWVWFSLSEGGSWKAMPESLLIFENLESV